MSTSLIPLFASKPLVKLLSILVLHPDERFYQQQLVRETGESLRSVQVALARIEQAGLLEKRREGRNAYYRLVAYHPALPGLRDALLSTDALARVLRDALAHIAPRLELAFVYGSVARGDDRADSDVDVIAVGDTDLSEVSDATWEVRHVIGRELGLTVYTPQEFRQGAEQEHHFVADVIVGPKIWLVGGDDELERLVGRRQRAEAATEDD